MLADCHMHMVLDGVEWKSAIATHSAKPNIEKIRAALQAYRSKGFTYLRDGGDRWGVGKTARELAPEYSITYCTPLAPLCMAGHYGSFIGTVYQDLREYARLVVATRENGGDFIKIMISGLMDFDRFGVLTEEGLAPEVIKQLIHIAHSEGMAVMAHANGARTIEAAALAGVDSVEHGAYQDKDSLAAMAAFNTVWVPTLSTVGNLRGKGRFSQYDVEKILDCAMENVSIFSSMGGLIAPGSDAGAWAVPHGCVTEFDLLRSSDVSDAKLEEGTRQIMARFSPALTITPAGV